jgi:hypothetical protein
MSELFAISGTGGGGGGGGCFVGVFRESGGIVLLFLLGGWRGRKGVYRL